MTEYCNREWLRRFIDDELGLEDKIDYLYHLEECPECWEKVYAATKANHPHYYKMSSGRVKMSERELSRIEGESAGEKEEVA